MHFFKNFGINTIFNEMFCSPACCDDMKPCILKLAPDLRNPGLIIISYGHEHRPGCR